MLDNIPEVNMASLRICIPGLARSNKQSGLEDAIDHTALHMVRYMPMAICLHSIYERQAAALRNSNTQRHAQPQQHH